MWLALAAITLAVAIGFCVLAVGNSGFLKIMVGIGQAALVKGSGLCVQTNPQVIPF